MAQRIRGLTSSPSQSFSVQIDEGQIRFTLRYSVRAKSWYLDTEYKGFQLNGLRIVSTSNLFSQYRNLLPFGLFVRTDFEPYVIDDFSSGRVILAVLSEAEVEQVSA